RDRQGCHTPLLHLTPMNQEAIGLAAGQDGLLIHPQLRATGYTNKQIKHLVNAGHLERLEGSLYVVAGAPATERQRVRALVIDAGAGAAASRRSAGELFGVPGYRDVPIEVATPYGCDHEFKLGRLYQSCLLPSHHITHIDGIAVTIPARMLFDLAADL